VKSPARGGEGSEKVTKIFNKKERAHRVEESRVSAEEEVNPEEHEKQLSRRPFGRLALHNIFTHLQNVIMLISVFHLFSIASCLSFGLL
jgi:hypothetical protein